MVEDWITADLPDLLGVLVSTAVVYIAIVLYCRITGLRSFSKMSASDFAMTLAVGSLFAGIVASPSPTLVLGLFALALLFAGQWFFAFVRSRFPSSGKLLDNRPILLMSGPRILEQNMKIAQVSRDDLYAKLRDANVSNFSQVRAVVFETTGDISVVRVEPDGPPLEVEIFDGVRGAGELGSAPYGD